MILQERSQWKWEALQDAGLKLSTLVCFFLRNNNKKISLAIDKKFNYLTGNKYSKKKFPGDIAMLCVTPRRRTNYSHPIMAFSFEDVG